MCTCFPLITYVLDGDEIRLDERDVVAALEHAHNTSVIDSRLEDGKQIIQEHGLLLEVE